MITDIYLFYVDSTLVNSTLSIPSHFYTMFEDRNVTWHKSEVLVIFLNTFWSRCLNIEAYVPSLLVLDCCRFLVRESVDLMALQASARSLSEKDFSRSDREKFALLEFSQSCVVYREYRAFLEKNSINLPGAHKTTINRFNDTYLSCYYSIIIIIIRLSMENWDLFTHGYFQIEYRWLD